jgi:hypothetical protein
LLSNFTAVLEGTTTVSEGQHLVENYFRSKQALYAARSAHYKLLTLAYVRDQAQTVRDALELQYFVAREAALLHNATQRQVEMEGGKLAPLVAVPTPSILYHASQALEDAAESALCALGEEFAEGGETDPFEITRLVPPPAVDANAIAAGPAGSHLPYNEEGQLQDAAHDLTSQELSQESAEIEESSPAASNE